MTLTSVAAQDGYVLEAGETTNVGGSIDATATTTSALRVGDNNQDRQYKAVVSFDPRHLLGRRADGRLLGFDDAPDR